MEHGRLFRAAALVGSGYLLALIIRFASNIILTRLLAPDAFGVALVVLNVQVILVVLTDMGIGASILRSSDAYHGAFRGTFWTLQVVIGALLCLIMASAGLALFHLQAKGLLTGKSAYTASELPGILLAVAAGMLTAGFKSLKPLYAQKELRQRELLRYELFNQVISTAITIALAATLRSVWALGIGLLTSQLVTTINSYLLFKGEGEHLVWDTSILRREWPFNRWIWVSSAFGVLASQSDRFLLSLFTSASLLGLYSVACGLIAAIEVGLSKIINMLGIPVLTQLLVQSPDIFHQHFRRIGRLIEATCFFLIAILLFSAHSIINLLYPAHYEGAGFFLLVLSTSLLNCRVNLSTQLFISLGQSNVQAFISVCRLVTTISAGLLGYLLGGTNGAVIGFASQSFVLLTISLMLERRVGIVFGRERIPIWLVSAMAGTLVGRAFAML